ncbi:MAG: hypothetical protein M3Q93_01635 [Gemmatimonadota bacterium]|nr:hypothetical protein [Gemmatimonadota bacterium]
MRRAFVSMWCAAWLGALGCGGDTPTTPAPTNDGQTLARQFEKLADSVDGGGYSPSAEALRHAAEIVRLTGHATPVTLTIDGTDRGLLAVAEQLDFPLLECTWPGDSGVGIPPDSTVVPPPIPDTGSVVPTEPIAAGDSLETPPGGSGGSGGCIVTGTTSMRTFIAWEPERMAEVVRIVADVGINRVDSAVPDVMSALPTGPGAGDTAVSGGGGFNGIRGFFGEYLVRDTGSWYAAEGSQSNELERSGGACTADGATFDWAEFECEAARFRFAFDMRVEPLRYEPLAQWAPGGEPPGSLAEGSRTLALAATGVDGVRLTVAAWTPPPLPPPPGPGPDPIPVDSAFTRR